MNDNELNSISHLIWGSLNTIENENKSMDEQIAIIKPIIEKLAYEQRKIGRRQILNHLENDIKNLREDTL